MQTISHDLIAWFFENKRPLPWRNDRHWYPIFLSEFLLQQTQVNQALPYYQKFIQRFPTIFDLAQAKEDEILQMWAGLGYYSRARNLLKSSKRIVEHFGGQFPKNLEEALQLPGIGSYTAAAILSLAFDQPIAVVDGNVIRVVTRLFAIKEDVRLTSTRNKVKRLTQHLLPVEQSGSFNEALMELGALVCKPVAPLCQECPLQKYCQSHHFNLADSIPFKSPPIPKKKRFNIVLVIRNFNNELLLAQRKEKGLLAKMWEFPAIEVDQLPPSHADVIPRIIFQNFNFQPVKLIQTLPTIKHTYSHIILQILPVLLEGHLSINNNKYLQWSWLLPENLNTLAIHKAHKKILGHPDFTRWLQSFNN